MNAGAGVRIWLAFEPVALGLLVAPSAAGGALALAAAAGFFVRRPLKLAVTTPADDPRRLPARRWAAVLMLGASLALAGAAALASACWEVAALLRVLPGGTRTR